MSQAIGNGFLGVVGAQLVEWLPGAEGAPPRPSSEPALT